MLGASALRPLAWVSCALWIANVNAFSPWSKRADDIKVNFPEGGESYSTGTDIDITWTASSADKAKLELRKGTPDRLVTVHLITSDTKNNGTYQWRSREDDFLRAIVSKTLPNAPPSACDYVIAVRTDKTTAHSGYFSIINQNDNGLPEDAECPESKAPPPIGGSSSSSGSDKPSDNNDKEGENGGDSGDKAGSDAAGDEESPPSNSTSSGTVTPATLGGAIGGVAGGLVIIFSAILLLGRSRGWFVDDEYIEKRVSAAVINIIQGNEDVKKRLYQDTEVVREIGSRPIHQLAA